MARLDSHIAVGEACFLGFAVFQGVDATGAALFAAAAGSAICDVDSERSMVGSNIPVVRFFKKFGIEIEHQGGFHSLTFLIFAGILASPLFFFGYREAFIAWLIGIFSHQVLDSIASDPSSEGRRVSGIQWLFPFSEDRFIFSPNSSFSIEYGSRHEAVIRWLALVAAIILLSVNIITPRVILNWHFADVRAASELIDLWSDRYELKADVRAKTRISNKPIEGTFDVEGVSQNHVILRNKDVLISIGDGFDTKAELRAEFIRIRRSKTIRVETHEINLTGQPLKNLARYIEVGRKYRLFCKRLTLREPAAFPVPSLRYSPVEITGTHVRLHMATLKDIEQIKHETVEEGIVTVKYFLAPGETVTIAEPLIPVMQEFEIHSPSEMKVVVSQFVFKGDILAVRAHISGEVKLKEKHIAYLRGEIENVKESYLEQHKYYTIQRKALLAKLEKAEEIAKVDSVLLSKNLIARTKAGTKKLEVQSLQASLEKLHSDETNTKLSAEARIEKLILEIEKAEHEVNQLRKKALVKSRYTGIVRDISFAFSKEKLISRIELEPVQNDSSR